MATVGTAGRAGGFEIGLVMAGAVSAGAYTAGVVDFLIQALDQWHEGKRGNDPRCPRHDVSLKVLAGASAGGMSVAIAAAQLREPHTPAADPRPPGPPDNKLLRSWVRCIDIARLLATSDLDSEPDGDVRSLLDSTALDEIAAAVFRREDGPPPPERSYLADPCTSSCPHGGALSQSALATGAFPLGIAPREVSRKMKEYAGREWPIPGPVEEGGRVVRCGQFRSIPQDFPERRETRTAVPVAKQIGFRHGGGSVPSGCLALVCGRPRVPIPLAREHQPARSRASAAFRPRSTACGMLFAIASRCGIN